MLTFPPDILDPYYLQFALGAGLREISERATWLWLQEPDTHEHALVFPPSITIQIDKLKRSIGYLGYLPLGDLGSSKPHSQALIAGLGNCLASMQKSWGGRKHVLYLDSIQGADEVPEPSKVLLKSAGFPVSSIVELIRLRSSYQESLLRPYSSFMGLGSLLMGIIERCVIDDDFPSITGMKLLDLDTDFGKKLDALLEAVHRYLPIPEASSRMLENARSDNGFIEKIRNLMCKIGKLLRENAKPKQIHARKLPPERLTPNRLAYEVLLNDREKYADSFRRYLKRYKAERSRGTSGFNPVPPTTVEAIKVQAKLFLKRYPYLPSVPRRNSGRPARIQ